MAMENNIGQTKQFTKGSIRRVKNMVKVSFCGKMIALIRENSSRIIFMALENMSGKMEEFMKDNGKITKWKVKESLPGLMAEGIKDSTKTIRRKASEFSLSEMEEFMKDSGKMESSTAKVYSGKRIFPAKECGKMDNG